MQWNSKECIVIFLKMRISIYHSTQLSGLVYYFIPVYIKHHHTIVCNDIDGEIAMRVLNTIKVVAVRKWWGDRKIMKKLYCAMFRSKEDYSCKLHTASLTRQNIKIYTGPLKFSFLSASFWGKMETFLILMAISG